ncbi:MAG: hypothetical protein WC492_00415 [Candidatus Micrarchaeia archaeon]
MQPSLILDLSLTSPAYSLAINLVVISIVLSALALGISRAISSRKLWAWGVEELAQSIINAILLGAIVSGALASGEIASSFVEPDLIANCAYTMPNMPIPNSPLVLSICKIDYASSKAWNAAQSLGRLSFSLGSLSSITANANVISATPFYALRDASSQYSQISYRLANIISAFEMQKQFLLFVSYAAFSIFLPAGLLLRMFFATRKLGGAIMAGAIGFFLVYPLCYSAFASDMSSLNESYSTLAKDLDLVSESILPFPAIDWGKSGVISNLVLNMSGQDVAAKVSVPMLSASSFAAVLEMYSLVYPLICIAITLVCIYELAGILGSEFRLDFFEKI